jgi:signal transduction histidine kinase/ligand-binding sensor domain-containing protein/DNA-binding response OmpR family regulator
MADNDPPVNYLGIEHGLSNNGVTSIFQDHNGFMWFGTFDGLNRYDGYSFKVFRNNLGDTTSLFSNYIRVIAEDASHFVWLGTGKGVNIFNPAKANFFQTEIKPWNSASLQLLDNGVNSIQKIDQSGSMLAGVQGKGLLLFEKGSRIGVQIPLMEWKGHEGNYDVTALAFDDRNQVAWLIVHQLGLCQYNLKNKTIRVINSAFKKADCLKLDNLGNLWLGNQKGLFLYDISSNSFSQSMLPYSYRVMNLFEDARHILWIATDGGGIWSMPIGSSKPIPYLTATGTPFVNSNTVYAIYDDPQGNKWIGTLRGGINVIQPGSKLFRHISFANGDQQYIVNDFILSLAEDDQNNVWIGTDGAGLRYWDRRKNTYIRYQHNAADPATLSNDFVTSILQDSQGDVWATTYFGGVNRLKRNSKKFEHFDCFNSYSNTIENNAWLIFQDSQKRLWLSTASGGSLYLFNRQKNRFEVFDTSLVSIQSLAEDRQGNIWAGNQTSIIRLDLINKKHKIYSNRHAARCIYEDSNRNFWIGTDGGGLLLLNRANGTFQQITTADGLPSNTILCMLEDKQKNLWLSTYNGLSKFNPANRSYRNFSSSDGLQSNQFSFHAAVALRSGEFIFGGIKGFNVFYPDSIYESKVVPRMYLTGLKINNKPIEEDAAFVTKRSDEWAKKIVLPYNKAILSLEYVALDYKGADKIKYAYKLDGWDKSWNYVNDIRSANYSRLHEGTYYFKIKVTSGAAGWTEENSLLTVVVLPPWYRAWWAYLLYAVVFISGMYLYILYSRKQERLKYEVSLANFKIEKEKELTEKKLSFFTNISHEFRSPLSLIINPIKDLLRKIDTPEEHKELNVVHRNARRLLSLVDQLLLFRKTDAEVDNMRFSKQNFYSLCEEVYLCFGQQAKMNHQEYIFECNNKELELFVDSEKIEIALFNLLSNAIKYTPPGGKIFFKVTDNETDVEISIIDNGYGIPKEAALHLFEKFYQADSRNAPAKTGFGIGLYLVKHFVEAHKGDVSFQSEEGKGTVFIVKLKKGNAHLNGRVIHADRKRDAVILEELREAPGEQELLKPIKDKSMEDVITDQRTILITDDDVEIRKYLHEILKDRYRILEAKNGKEALKVAQESFPDLIISDIRMDEMDGIKLCKQIKENESLNHIPVILLTGSHGPELELQSVEGGADVYITKPFDKDILLAKVENLFRSRTELQNYFLNEITLKKNTLKISSEYKEFLERCITIVEGHLDDDQFTIKTLADEIGMSHSYLYKKIRQMSGQSIAGFIRYIRLRKGAELMIKADCNVNEAAYQVGISDVKYFRVQFHKLFGMNPSEYIKKYREPFNKNYQVSPRVLREKPKNRTRDGQ